ncbi:MAG: crossover junction endodeoxyribonuclease RuvC [Anaerovibrio sp.]|nr:crossover junction endodeoxyribonuclease RuvC [Selenomonadaceae bacterium]MDD6397953.1 crossover junction endodeoxyribonuclease RuvC [Selenomonadaceae bacterium]MDY6052749.1 crossover junction endodeoxyribonuclease RuvC [Anaerovibrio sp.]
MLALGIDPGTAICGYGFVESRGSNLIAHKYGAITTSPKAKMEDRLLKIFDGLNEMIKEFKPDVMGIEQLFFNRNVDTAIPVGQARGVIMLAAAKNNLPIIERTPLQVKQSVTGYGKADKEQVIYMVTKILNLPKPPKPDDVADALAVAICTSHIMNSFTFRNNL